MPFASSTTPSRTMKRWRRARFSSTGSMASSSTADACAASQSENSRPSTLAEAIACRCPARARRTHAGPRRRSSLESSLRARRRTFAAPGAALADQIALPHQMLGRRREEQRIAAGGAIEDRARPVVERLRRIVCRGSARLPRGRTAAIEWRALVRVRSGRHARGAARRPARPRRADASRRGSGALPDRCAGRARSGRRWWPGRPSARPRSRSRAAIARRALRGR